MSQSSLWMLVLLPAVVGGALALSRRLDRVAAAVSVTTAALTAALSVLVAVQRPVVAVPFMAGSDLALGVDPLAGVVVPTIAVVTLLVLVFSAVEIHESRGRFHGLMLLFASSALVTAAATTLPTLLLAWEVMGATSYALIGFWWREEHRVSAGLTAFVTTRGADLGLYVAAGAALAGGAGLSLEALPQGSDGWRHVVAAGVLVAALGKAAQLPFSFWLSRAMEGPSPVSALLHSAAMVAMGGYLLLRTEPLLASVGWAAPATAWAGALTALLLGAVAVAQRDLKQLLAASTSAQLGFVVMAAGLASVSGGAAHLVAHASTKALLFLAAGAWLSALGTKELDGLRGAARRWPVVAWSSTLGLLSLAGVAPLALWATKDAVLAAALAESPWLYGVGLAAAALSAAYAGKVLVIVWRGVPDADRASVDTHLDEEVVGTRAVHALQQAPLVVLAAGATVLSLLALPPLGDMVARALGEGTGPHATPLEMATSAALAVIVALAVWRWRLPEPRWAFGWLGLERAAHATVVRPTLRVAGLLARFDDRVLDRAVEALAAATLRSAGRAGSADHRWVDGAVEGLAEQSRRLGRLARRPQTGQLYQYYIQAIVVLAVGFLLLVTVR
ncbi:MAG TPA: proton-conducting transporter membrane subunit [Nocardioidaceae bacterium]|nr:proton-conducting transporter membrane subunit [Nocardioidaceae bacterium]